MTNVVNVTQKNNVVVVRGQGARGLQGPAGTSGFNFLNGSGAPDNGLGNNGDTYLDTTNGILYEKINNVWIQGNKIVSPGIYSFTYEKQSMSNTWEINHNLGFRPSVSVMDYGQNNIECDIDHIDENNLILTFSEQTSGYAYLS